MKKIVTIDDLMIGFVMAIGYGLGFAIPKAMGWSDLESGVICCVVGWPLQELATRILFSKTVQNKTAYRYMVFGVFISFVKAATALIMGIGPTAIA